MPLDITVTNAGRAALVNAQNTGTDPVTITEVGLSQTAVVPAVTDIALAGEFKRVAGVAGEVVADDTIHINMVDSTADVYSLRSFALYLDDGTMFAIYGQVDPILEKTVQSIGALSIDAIFADIAAALLTFGNANFTNPPATTERQGVVELTTNAEAQAGTDSVRALTVAAAVSAILPWLLAVDGSGSGLDADLLDGQDGGYYANIIARLGYTPVNRAGDVMTGLLTLSGAPTAANHAATKTYIDNLVTAAALLAKLLTVDGAGSGLDADLLDGQQGSYYADVLTKLLAVDGSGSGIDADLLDGQHGSFFRDLANATGILPDGRLSGDYSGLGDVIMQRLRLTATDDLSAASTLHALQIGPDDGVNTVFDGNEVMTRDNGSPTTTYFEAGIYIGASADVAKQGSPYYHPSNDGSGSGLDADLLDGQHASYFQKGLSILVDTASALVLRIEIGGTPWYFQMGTGSCNGNSSASVTFAQAYAGRALALASGGGTSTNVEGDVHDTSNSLTSVSVINSGSTTTSFKYIAFGR